MKNIGDKHIIEELKSKLKKDIPPIDIVSAALFGSTAKGTYTGTSDIDIIIAANKINPERKLRGWEIVQLKKHFEGTPLDIMLLTPEEVEANFHNHNPLFLDIAEDCTILFDRKNFFRNLVNETRTYIRESDIKRLKDGWEFPVKRGIPTYLSPVSNRDFSIAMLKDGERDFLIARKLLIEGFYDKSVYHSQQAVEKSIKSILVSMGIYHKTHFVGEILRTSLNKQPIENDWKNRLSEAAEAGESIELDVSLSRYPGIKDGRLWLPYEEYKKQDAENAAKKAESILSTAKDFFDYWFGSR